MQKREQTSKVMTDGLRVYERKPPRACRIRMVTSVNTDIGHRDPI